MNELQFPEAYWKSDAASLAAQRAFFWSTRVQLILLIVASAIGSLGWALGRWNIASFSAGVAFLAAAGLRLRTLRRRPHGRWYGGRAAAESIKTLSWRYAVGGHPFPLAKDQENSVSFQEKVSELGHEIEETFAVGATTPTPSMEAIRTTSLDDRKSTYERDRIQDQQRWYSSKAGWNRRRARLWSLVILALQVGAAAGAFAKGLGSPG